MKWQNESFFELSQDLLFVIDFDNIILEVNSACDKILSREKEEVIQLPVLELIHPQDITLTLNEFSNNLNNGKSTNFICRFLHKDSSYRWMNLNVSVDFKNKLKYVVARDITDSRNAEDELHRVFNNIPALIGHWDKNLINKFANTGYADLLDNSPENIKGKHIKDILHDRTYQKNISFINRVLAGESQVFEREKILEDGSLRHIFVRYIPDIKENSVVGFLTSVRATRSCGRVGPAKHGTTVDMSSSRVSV